MSFRHVVHCMSQLKRFSNPFITKKVAKKGNNTAFNLTVYLSQEKALNISLRHKKKLQQMV